MKGVINAFLWKVAVNALQVKNKLRKAFPQVKNKCVLCNKNSKIVQHLMQQCSFINLIWRTWNNMVDLSIFAHDDFLSNLNFIMDHPNSLITEVIRKSNLPYGYNSYR